VIGLVVLPGGAFNRLPLAVPLMTRIKYLLLADSIFKDIFLFWLKLILAYKIFLKIFV
jgi:hypothetical protein